jgi:hypothetical protein
MNPIWQKEILSTYTSEVPVNLLIDMRVNKFTIQILNVKPLTNLGQKPALLPVIGRKISLYQKQQIKILIGQVLLFRLVTSHHKSPDINSLAPFKFHAKKQPSIHLICNLIILFLYHLFIL